MAADIAGTRCYEVEIFESVDAAREMRRVVPFELVEHVADGTKSQYTLVPLRLP